MMTMMMMTMTTMTMTMTTTKLNLPPSGLTIPLGGLFTIAKNDGNRLPSEIKFDIRQCGMALQSLTIHTSCSKELNEGDRFGGTTLRTFVPEN